MSSRRGGGVQAYRRRAAATEREIDAAVAAVKAERRAGLAAARAEHAEREASRRRFTREDIEGAGFVHDGYQWRKVVRVNKTTVSVASGYSWVDRIKFKDVHGVQQPIEGAEVKQ
ncbi:MULTISPECIES: hypothetical protein [unclassified Microbacterium]|uniref:hypothetical protein n=1 Tax=unclassified Microbacterium TaxID=2609290 RepID=UPI0034359594